MSRLWGFIAMLGFYIWEVILSNVRVAHDVLTPRHLMKPGIIVMDVTGMSDRQLILTANLITMTPGTLGLTFSKDRKRLYIHAMYIDGSPQELARDLEQNYGGRIRRVF